MSPERIKMDSEGKTDREKLIHLAQSLVSQDYDKACRLGCGKKEWGTKEDHKHKPKCPFALAYEILAYMKDPSE